MTLQHGHWSVDLRIGQASVDRDAGALAWPTPDPGDVQKKQKD
jgi:hypothetical protein